MGEFVGVNREIIKGRAQLAEMITTCFQQLEFGQAGEKRRNGSTVSAQDVIASWRELKNRHADPENQMTMWQAFQTFVCLQMEQFDDDGKVPDEIVKRILEVTGLWVTCYGMDAPDGASPAPGAVR